MRRWGHVGRALVCVALFASTSAFADETSGDNQCEPACHPGSVCKEGECVKEQCKPRCRKDFLCVDGECKSPCNPPCASNERCTATLECVRMSTLRPGDDTRASSSEAHEPSDVSASPSKASKYKPSAARLYVGPMLWTPLFASVPTDFGATLALALHGGDSRVLFGGIRASFAGDRSGEIIMVAAEFGLRPRAYESEDVALSFPISVGIGGAFISAAGLSVGTFYAPVRFGPCFDFGAFTFEVLVGPALLAQKAALGVFESIVEIGVRL